MCVQAPPRSLHEGDRGVTLARIVGWMNKLHNNLSARLQTENPFDEFQKAVEKAILEKASTDQAQNYFQGDKAFFSDASDNGMTISMHQPWASLMVAGFKRFEGRDWNHKYRGPLWV